VSTKLYGKREREQQPSWAMQVFAWTWIGFILLIALFNNGIFQGYGIHNPSSYRFEVPVLYSMIVVFFLLVWVAIHLLMKNVSWKISLIYGIAALLIPAVYLISSYQAASPYLSKYGIFVSLMLFVFFVAGIQLAGYRNILRWFPTVYLIFGYCIVFYGFLTLFGNAYMLDSLTPQDGVRISSIFQYPNTYAVLLLTLWIAILIELERSRNKWVQLLHAFMLVPVCVSFLLTLSRGALFVLPVIAVVALAMFPLRRQLMGILYSAISIGLSLLIYSLLTDRGIAVVTAIQEAAANRVPFDTVSMFSKETFGYWGLVIGISLVMSAIACILERYVDPAIAKATERIQSRWANAALPLVLIAIFVLGAFAVLSGAVDRFLPAIIRERVEDISLQTHSVYERLTMYKDALAIWKDHPILGAGAGAWEALFERYQSYPYSSMQTHSYYMQLLVETGIVGFAAVVGFIAVVLVMFLRTFRKLQAEERSLTLFYFVTPVTILLHSLIDFGMSYLLYGFIVFLCLGILAGTQRKAVFGQWSESGKRRLQQSAAAMLGIVSIVLVVFAAKWLYANNLFNQYTKAVDANQTYETMMGYLNGSLRQNPGQPIVLNQAAALNYQAYEQTQEQRFLDEAKRYLNKLVSREPNYQLGLYLNYLVHVAAGDNDNALKLIMDVIEKNKYGQSYYEQAASILLKRWDEERKAAADRSQTEEEIIRLYEQMVRLRAGIDALPDTVIVSKPFEVPNSVRAVAGQVYYFKGDYAQAEEVLKPGLKEDLSEQNDRYVARYYLASLRKQGKDDPELYEKLLQADQGEGAMLEQLLQ